RLSHRLHPSQLAYIGLTKSLAAFCQEFARRKGIRVDFAHDEIPELPAEVTTCLYRVAQEAIRNAEKHSGCSRIGVKLATSSESVCLSVTDSGRGFSVAAIEGTQGLGLVSMAERAHSLGGELSVRSEVDRGTRIEVSIPVAVAH